MIDSNHFKSHSPDQFKLEQYQSLNLVDKINEFKLMPIPLSEHGLRSLNNKDLENQQQHYKGSEFKSFQAFHDMKKPKKDLEHGKR